MSDWQERITTETAPAIRAEHELRYRTAAPLILAGGLWADLGCGNGLAAAAALGDRRPARAVLVDLEPQTVASAAHTLGIAAARTLSADLTAAADLERIGAALDELGGEPVVTCFEVVEHLSSFLALLEWAGALVRERAATFVISVPNDAFWSIQNPHHLTSWSAGAFEELRRLLPAEQTLLRQVALSGSALTSWDAEEEHHQLSVAVGGERTIATHFLAAFGPRHAELGRSALAVQTEMTEQRMWERQRENDLALMQKLAGEHEAEVEGLERELRENTATFDQWRTYIHELEGELGRPLSGSAEAIAAEAPSQQDPARPAEPAEPNA